MENIFSIHYNKNHISFYNDCIKKIILYNDNDNNNNNNNEKPLKRISNRHYIPAYNLITNESPFSNIEFHSVISSIINKNNEFRYLIKYKTEYYEVSVSNNIITVLRNINFDELI